MKKIFVFTAIIIVVNCFYSTLSAQSSVGEIDGRYIIVDDINSFFYSDKDSNIVQCSFELYNIYEGESSKPVFVNVNELSNVIEFGIKSKSGRYENQRSCTLQMSPSNYISTFRLVLDRMNVEKILYQGELYEVKDFCEKIK